MIAVFFDRRNRRQVTNEELMPINLVYGVITPDVDDPDFQETIDTGHLPEAGGRNIQLGEFGYKSEFCEDYKNWDLWCMYTDLIFLHFKDDKIGKSVG